MLPVVLSAGGFRLLVGALPITLLLLFAGLIVLISLFMSRDRREFVLRLAPHLENAIRAIAGSPKRPASVGKS
jgi:hypothetical protein